MKTYYKFILTVFLRSFIFVSLVMISLVIILNILSELEFFRDIEVSLYLPIYISILNSPSLIFEMFPFIFLAGFLFIIFSETTQKLIQSSLLNNIKIFIIPLAIFLLLYFLIKSKINFKYEKNLNL